MDRLEVGVGDDVFLAGLFANHYGTKKNIPIIRVGNIAAMPEELIDVRDFGMMEAYLVESRSLGGISGSPVFVHVPGIRALTLMPKEMLKNVTPLDSVYYLLGLMHGHWDTMLANRDELNESDRIGQLSVNMGIAIVVPASKIREVIEQPIIRKSEDEKERLAREAQLPMTDGVGLDSLLTQSDRENGMKEPETSD